MVPSLGFRPTKTLYKPLLSSISATCPAHFSLLDFITRMYGEEYRALSSSLRSLLHSPVTSSLLGPQYPPQHPILENPHTALSCKTSSVGTYVQVATFRTSPALSNDQVGREWRRLQQHDQRAGRFLTHGVTALRTCMHVTPEVKRATEKVYISNFHFTSHHLPWIKWITSRLTSRPEDFNSTPGFRLTAQ
jgi:hypothetical protein